MNDNITYLIDFIALAVIYFIFFYKKWKNRGKDRLLINTTMYVYISFVLYFTLMPIIVSIPFVFNHAYMPMNLNIFEDYFLGRGDAVRQIFLNVIMMIPFGFFLPIIKKQKLWSCALWTFLFSLGIELIQPLIDGFRSSDITDLFTNTMGGIIGYILYIIFKPLIEVIIKYLRSNH
ncbi:VanZ family protein [Anaerovorax odorimutans]|uniref:VanZ family protein n=1 Tax=Anaerovorax odorimutans TaxID=109327 RepID=UPI00040EDE0E|nr:VanZ family protein [Anaerovorax odorimutans]